MKRKPGRPRGQKTSLIRIHTCTKKVLEKYSKSRGETVAEYLSGYFDSWPTIELKENKGR